MRNFLFVLLALFCFSCSPVYYTYSHVAPDPYKGHRSDIPVYVDGSFTPTQEKAIAESITEWNSVLNGYLTIRVVTWKFNRQNEEGQAIVRKIDATSQGLIILNLHDDDSLLEGLDTGRTLAFVDGLGRQAHMMVVLSDQIGNRDLETILMHEWGHALGAQHVTSRSLMHNFYDGDMQVSCIDWTTVEQVAAYQHLKMEHLNYCVVPEEQ